MYAEAIKVLEQARQRGERALAKAKEENRPKLYCSAIERNVAEYDAALSILRLYDSEQRKLAKFCLEVGWYDRGRKNRTDDIPASEASS